jgi:ribosomal protein L28
MFAKCKYTGKKPCIWNNIPRQSECDIGIAPENNAATD